MMNGKLKQAFRLFYSEARFIEAVAAYLVDDGFDYSILVNNIDRDRIWDATESRQFIKLELSRRLDGRGGDFVLGEHSIVVKFLSGDVLTLQVQQLAINETEPE